MTASTQRVARQAAQPITAPRRFSHLLFGFLSSSTHAEHTEPTERASRDGVRELADDPAMHEVFQALQLQQAHEPLPAGLSFIPGRICETADLEALGLSDSRRGSVTVDLAIWHTPCGSEPNDVAWRRVFTWVTGVDRDLCSVSIVTPPAESQSGLRGGYGYVAGGVAGYGVLHINLRSDGSWRIVDCWGDAADQDRIDELAVELAESA